MANDGECEGKEKEDQRMEERVRLDLLRGCMERLREIEDNYGLEVPYWERAEEERRTRDGEVWRVEPWEVVKERVITQWGGREISETRNVPRKVNRQSTNGF